MEWNDDELEIFAERGAPALPTGGREGYVTHDGARLWYATFGSGTPVILLHGGLGHAGNWGYQLPALLSSGYRVLLVDSRGHGRSTRDAQPYTYEKMAADLLSILDAVNWPKSALVGWSDGACTALIFARQNPGRVSGVFFFACNMDPSGTLPLIANARVDRCFSRHARDYAALSATPEQFDSFVEAISTMMKTEPNYSAEDLAQISVPVAIVHSEYDEFIKREHAEYLSRTIPGAEFILLRNVSHFAPLQRPGLFNETMLNFLQRLPQAQSYHMDQLPLPFPFYIKAVLGRRHYKEGQRLPATRIEWPNFEFPASAVQSYAKICAWPWTGQELPLLFPHSYFGPLHLKMLTDENFPLRVLGGVHLRNHVIQRRPLFLRQRYDAALFFTESRRRPQGLEVDFKTEIRQGSMVVWESITTFLFRRKFKAEDAENSRARLLQNLNDAVDKASFPVPMLTGKQFGWITKDINPIHMSRYLAKAFGFERDLCHGMWALSRSLPLAGAVDWQKPLRNDVSFKGPLYMERDITVKVSRGTPGLFELLSAGNERPCVLGSLKNVGADEKL